MSNKRSSDARHDEPGETSRAGGRAQGQHFAGDLRRALLDAAAAAIAERGVEAPTLRDIARRAGVSHAAPAHHFGDKAGLLTALATEGFLLLADELRRAREHLAASAGTSGPADPVDVLASLGCAYVAFADAHPGHFELMFRPSLFDLTDAEFLAAGDAAHAQLVEGVDAARATGWGRQAARADLVAYAWAHVHGLSSLRIQGALSRYHPDDSMAFVRRLTRLFVASLADGSTLADPR